MNGFVDFSEVKARCSIEQAAKLLGLQTTEERNQLRAPCPACHVVIESLGIDASTAEALGIGYAPMGMMKGTSQSLFDCRPAS